MRELMTIMTALMKDPSNVVETNLHTTGYILIDSGIEELAAAVGAKATEEKGPDGTRFLAAAFGDLELLQVAEECADSEWEAALDKEEREFAERIEAEYEEHGVNIRPDHQEA